MCGTKKADTNSGMKVIKTKRKLQSQKTIYRESQQKQTTSACATTSDRKPARTGDHDGQVKTAARTTQNNQQQAPQVPQRVTEIIVH